MKPFHNNLKTSDVWGWNLDAGADIRLYDYGSGSNQQWILEYAEDGYFYIRSRFNGKYMEVAGGSSDAGANIQMGDGPGGHHQQWRLLPSGALVEFDAPSAPAGLAAASGKVSVRLSWSANGESDLKGYNIYRSLSSEGPYELVARNVTASSFVDKAANQSGAYYYHIRAVDKSLNRSVRSEQVMAAPSGGDALVTALAFEEDVSDSSGNDNAAVASSDASYLSGKVGSSALYFNGATFYASLPATVANHDQLTIASWVYWGGGSDEQRVFDFGNGADSRLYLTPKAIGGGLKFVVKDGGVEQSLDAPEIEPNKWIHVAVALDGSEGRFYVDGALADSGSVTIKPADITPVLNYLGKGQSSSDPFFKGRLDEFRLYNYVLGEPDIASLAGIAPPPAPVQLSGNYTGSEVALSWNAVPGATRYIIKRSESSEGPFASIATEVLESSYSDTEIGDAANLYYVVVAVSDLGESEDSETISVALLTPGEQWRLEHFRSVEATGDAADDADPDGDLVSNLLERAFGGDPNVVERDLLPYLDESVPLLAIVYRRSALATDLEYFVQESSDLLSPWSASAGSSETLSEEGGVQWIRFSRSVGDDEALFLRVELSRRETF